jgi:hypothetical protein
MRMDFVGYKLIENWIYQIQNLNSFPDLSCGGNSLSKINKVHASVVKTADVA